MMERCSLGDVPRAHRVAACWSVCLSALGRYIALTLSTVARYYPQRIRLASGLYARRVCEILWRSLLTLEWPGVRVANPVQFRQYNAIA